MCKVTIYGWAITPLMKLEIDESTISKVYAFSSRVDVAIKGLWFKSFKEAKREFIRYHKCSIVESQQMLEYAKKLRKADLGL